MACIKLLNGRSPDDEDEELDTDGTGGLGNESYHALAIQETGLYRCRPLFHWRILVSIQWEHRSQGVWEERKGRSNG